MKHMRSFLAVLSFLTMASCGEAPPLNEPFHLVLQAATDDGKPLADVAFSTPKSPLGKSSASGRVSVRLRVGEGTVLRIGAECPAGYLSPTPQDVRLTHTKSVKGDMAEPLRFSAVCTRKVRDIVVVVHVENGKGLPVAIDGEPAGTIDGKGNAHLRVSVDREVKSLSVSLDTSDKASLRPQNPRRVFELSGNDAILLFNQPLKRIRRRPVVKAQRAPRRHVPYRVRAGKIL